MFTPFYPGDEWVDWVGMSVFHFGQVGSNNPTPAL
jgi:beta-mannanase